MEIFNEKDLVSLKLSGFKDDQGNALSPAQITAVWYRADELGSGTNQVPQTNLSAPFSDPLYIQILPTENVMVDAAKDKEIVAILVHFEWGPNTGKTKSFLYQRNNLRFLS